MHYELTIAAANDSAQSVFSQIEKIIKDLGSLTAAEKLGKKQLAYPIAKNFEAEYFVFNFQTEPGNIKNLWEKLRLEQETILRYLIVKKGKLEKKTSKVSKQASKETKVEEKASQTKTKLQRQKKPKSAKSTKESKNPKKGKVKDGISSVLK